jgi:flagellar motor switch protein FliN/FliY
MATDEVTGVVDQESAAGNQENTAEVAPAPQLDGAEPQPAQDTHTSELAADLAATIPDAKNLDMLLDVNLKVTVELGRAKLKFRDVLNLATGSIVELAKQTSEPVDILVNGALLATGEVVVTDDHFAVRITKLLNRVERLKKVI